MRFVALTAEARAYLRSRTRGCASRLCDLAPAADCDVVEFCARFPHAFLVQTERSVGPDDRSEVFFVCSRAEPLNPWRAVMVGRDEDSDVRLRAPSVSRKHALFERDRASGGYLVRDLGAAVGTRIDGALVREQPRPIASKSTLQIGRLSFVFLDALDAHEILESTLRSRIRRAR
jgi:pSer/pThr/pTyr-binding forkhead associated (FHA) protein